MEEMAVEFNYEQIDGFFTRNDRRFYHFHAQTAPESGHFVEIGSWKGRSAFCMASELERLGKATRLTCVDTWEGSEEHAEHSSIQKGTLYDEFLTNISRYQHRIQPMRLPSLEAAATFPDRSLDFVFIDAAHDYENVKADIHAWAPKVKPSGVLAGHDYYTWPGVRQAVDEVIGNDVTIFDGLWSTSEERQDLRPFYLVEYYKRGLRNFREWFFGTKKAG